MVSPNVDLNQRSIHEVVVLSGELQCEGKEGLQRGRNLRRSGRQESAVQQRF
jgi:hypothetical protein